MEVLTEAEILSAFDAGQGEIPVPDLDVIEWPVLDYLGWIPLPGKLQKSRSGCTLSREGVPGAGGSIRPLPCFN